MVFLVYYVLLTILALSVAASVFLGLKLIKLI
uniref:Cytochrome b6-f complex subunit 6 n=1 Tax=Eustigmatophyceae sp. Chic 10/23 P-6w TaxID=1446905 RepID=A0A3R5U061_9STRA|nr:cytochrome b6-f complex subunit 6 [Eustigmatophyceae sp. Chic 10/23 P-6w]QAA11601.1 cytochrome b6-f complex subunit 6 [Eustigmatophyceae sp. Chic 10/23 P-6w]